MQTKRISLDVGVQVGKLSEMRGRALMMGVFEKSDVVEGLLEEVETFSGISLKGLIERKEVRGEFKEYTLVHLNGDRSIERIILMGLGKREDYYLDKVRSVAAKAARTLRKAFITEMVVAIGSFPGFDPEVVAQAIVEGTIMGVYRPKRFTNRDDTRAAFERVIFQVEDESQREAVERGAAEGRSLAEAVCLCRDLANEPGNLMTPAKLAEQASSIAEEYKMECSIWGPEEIREHKMGGILAVSSGSEEEPRLIIMKYRGTSEKGPSIAYVGKGLTFDAGGISLKPAERMSHMKYDMAGGAAVIAAMQAIAELKLPINITAIVPASENLPDGKSYKPGDVLTMYAPKYVEIVNTDAEGRLLLADALHYACQQDPDFVVDMATLTGGCVVALGTMVTGVMSNCDWLTRQLIDAGISHEEKMWRLPLFPEYHIQIRSPIADVANSGGRPASASTAGKFLQEFVDRPWAHLDIAGTAWIEEDNSQYYHQSYLPPRGATGWGVRTLTILAQMIAQKARSGKTLRKLLKS